MKTIWISVLWVLLNASIPAMSQNAEDLRRDIPFQLHEGYIIVTRGSIGNLAKLSFMIDTGCYTSVVDQRILRKLKLGEIGRQQVTSFDRNRAARTYLLPELQLGPIRVSSLPVFSGDFSYIGDTLGQSVQAQIGLDVLRRSNFTIDFKRRILSFRKTAPLESTISLEPDSQAIVASVKIQGSDFRLVVDSGARNIVLFRNQVQDRLPTLKGRGEVAVRHIAGQSSFQLVSLNEVSLGKTRLRDLTACLLEGSHTNLPKVDGVLAISALQARRLHFDFESNTMSWER